MIMYRGNKIIHCVPDMHEHQWQQSPFCVFSNAGMFLFLQEQYKVNSENILSQFGLPYKGVFLGVSLCMLALDINLHTWFLHHNVN